MPQDIGGFIAYSLPAVEVLLLLVGIAFNLVRHALRRTG